MDPKKHVEQFEIIEHHVTTSRRPISPSAALNYIPSTEVRRSSETFLTSGLEADRIFRDEAERRYHLTGERDASFGIAGASPLRDNPPLLQSTPERSYNNSGSGINNFGYDLHEIHTNQGGTQIVHTYGAGNVFDDGLMRDRSLNTSIRPGFTETTILNPILNASASPSSHHATFDLPLQPQSILKNTSGHFHSSEEDNSLARKDSYKKMQESHIDNASVYAPSSNATMLSRQSKKGGGHTSFSRMKKGANCCRSVGQLFNTLSEEFKDTEKTPALLCAICLVIFFLILVVLMTIMYLFSIFTPYGVNTFLMYPPACAECIRRNPGASTYRDPSRLYVHVNSPSEIDFEMIGNHPLKSNSYTVADFTTGYIAIADHSLTDKSGRHFNCFLMKMDREALPSMDVVLDALYKTYREVHSENGWQEHWQFVVKPIDRNEAISKFHSTINDCVNAKWYQLEHAVYTRDSSCSSCYDFCFPDYAIQRREKYYDDISIAVRRLNCFRYYVPEWINYSIESDEDGNFKYPRRPHETQRDEHGNWINDQWASTNSWNSWSPISVVGRPDTTDLRHRNEFSPINS